MPETDLTVDIDPDEPGFVARVIAYHERLLQSDFVSSASVRDDVERMIDLLRALDMD